jgi:hypothetical protein
MKHHKYLSNELNMPIELTKYPNIMNESHVHSDLAGGGLQIKSAQPKDDFTSTHVENQSSKQMQRSIGSMKLYRNIAHLTENELIVYKT